MVDFKVDLLFYFTNTHTQETMSHLDLPMFPTRTYFTSRTKSSFQFLLHNKKFPLKSDESQMPRLRPQPCLWFLAGGGGGNLTFWDHIPRGSLDKLLHSALKKASLPSELSTFHYHTFCCSEHRQWTPCAHTGPTGWNHPLCDSLVSLDQSS